MWSILGVFGIHGVYGYIGERRRVGLLARGGGDRTGRRVGGGERAGGRDLAGSARGKAIGLMQSAWAVGYLLAAVLAAIVLPRWGWRALFLAGVLPALATLWIRRNIPEPAGWKRQERSLGGALGTLLRPPLVRHVVLFTAMCSCVLFGYWGMFTWLPAYLSSPVEKGGAGLSVLRSSAWIVPLQVGAFFGYFSFGFFADQVGRRAAFLTFVLSTAVLVPVYGLLGRNVALATGDWAAGGLLRAWVFQRIGRDGGGVIPGGGADYGAGLLL